jgi:hypothetical protein
MKDAPAAKQGVQPRHRVYRAPTFMPLWALIGGAAVIAVIERLRTVAARQVPLLCDLCAQHRPDLGLHRHS